MEFLNGSEQAIDTLFPGRRVRFFDLLAKLVAEEPACNFGSRWNAQMQAIGHREGG